MEPFQGFDKSHLKLVTNSYFLLYWAKMEFDKSLENHVRVLCVCKVFEPLDWTIEQEYPEDVDRSFVDELITFLLCVKRLMRKKEVSTTNNCTK